MKSKTVNTTREFYLKLHWLFLYMPVIRRSDDIAVKIKTIVGKAANTRKCRKKLLPTMNIPRKIPDISRMSVVYQKFSVECGLFIDETNKSCLVFAISFS